MGPRREANPRAGWGIVRGLLLIVAGIAVSFHPALSMVVLAAVIGGVLFFIGIQEVFTTAVRLTPRIEHALAVLEKKERASVPPAVVVGALVLLIAGAGVFWLTHPGDETVAASASIDACNGHPELCDRRLDQVAFATTHNSMSAADIPDWMFPNQERGIRGQLEDGVRGFLIDVHYGVPVGDRVKTLIENEENARKKYEAVLGKEGVEAAMRIRERLIGEKEGERDVYLCHGFCELGDTRFVAALEEMRDFLVANPNEVLIIVVQDEGVAPADVAACFAKSGLEKFVYKGSVKPPWPTLREMIATGRTRPRVRREQRGGRPVVPPGDRGDPGDAVRVQGSVGVLERAESRRQERFASPHEPLDRDDAGAAPEQRGDRQRLRFSPEESARVQREARA